MLRYWDKSLSFYPSCDINPILMPMGDCVMTVSMEKVITWAPIQYKDVVLLV